MLASQITIPIHVLESKTISDSAAILYGWLTAIAVNGCVFYNLNHLTKILKCNATSIRKYCDMLIDAKLITMDETKKQKIIYVL